MTASQDEFDRYAEQYDDALQMGLSITGEAKDYFMERRISWIHHRWQQWSGRSSDAFAGSHQSEFPLHAPLKILDFGCGTGGSVPLLQSTFAGSQVTGIDSSVQSIAIAQQMYGQDNRTFLTTSQTTKTAEYDLVYCNGVFHHIPVENQAQIANDIFHQIVPGGWFCFWENNPWNPGTRMVMRRIPFDRDAKTLTYRESKRLLQSAGFRILAVDFCLYFPRFLAALRWLESSLVRVPLGAQYCVFAQKPRGDR